MARKTANVTIDQEGRDRGKVFVLTELPASKAEAWAYRALLALIAGGVEMPEGFERMGMAGMAEMGIRALSGLKWEVADPLLAEMWECVRIMPDPTKPQIIRALIEEDVEEITTRIKLRAEVWSLHSDFLKAVAPSLMQGVKTAAPSNDT
jgi:flagellar motor component MotA